MERHDLRMSDLEGVLWGQFIQPSALWVTLLFSIPDRWLCSCFLSITCCLEMAFSPLPPSTFEVSVHIYVFQKYWWELPNRNGGLAALWMPYGLRGWFCNSSSHFFKGCVTSLSIIARKKLTISGLLALELIILQLWEVLDLRSLFVNNNYNLFLRHWHVSSIW